jgi:hypothetical protein
MSRLSFFPWAVLPRCEESLEATGFAVILVGPKLSMASEQSSSAGFLLA